jgi:dienelactone hydrolase
LANQKPVKPPPKAAPTAPDDDETADGQAKGSARGKAVKPGGAKDAVLPPSWPGASIKHSLVKYGDGNVNLTGFMAYGNATLEKRPVVIIVPDADGIGNYERWRASMLAANGYVGFVADLYGNGVEQGPGLPIASRSALLKAYVTNEGLLKGRVINALNAVRNLPMIDQSRVAVVGWGFGGAAALQLFRFSSEADGVLAVAAFHPAPLTMADWTKRSARKTSTPCARSWPPRKRSTPGPSTRPRAPASGRRTSLSAPATRAWATTPQPTRPPGTLCAACCSPRLMGRAPRRRTRRPGGAATWRRGLWA